MLVDTHEATTGQAAAGREHPLRVMFFHTSLFVGGAEALLVELIRRLDRSRFAPEVCCLKSVGPLADSLPGDVPVFHDFIRHKYDLPVVMRLVRLLRRRQTNAIVTVGAGDKMFWGRLAAWLAGVPVIASALHSTGWPDGISRLNRLLTPLTDAFIAVAAPHARYLVEREKLPRVHVVLNGIDTERFRPRPPDAALRASLGIPPEAPVAGIVARLSREKNHEMFLDVARRVRERAPRAHFLIAGDGFDRPRLEELARDLGVADYVHFLGDRPDVPELLALIDVFLLTSHVEASPVSILEALATGKPVVATRVGSVSETVVDGEVGYVVEPGDAAGMADRTLELFADARRAGTLGARGRRLVIERASVERMVEGYQDLLENLYHKKTSVGNGLRAVPLRGGATSTRPSRNPGAPGESVPYRTRPEPQPF